MLMLSISIAAGHGAGEKTDRQTHAPLLLLCPYIRTYVRTWARPPRRA